MCKIIKDIKKKFILSLTVFLTVKCAYTCKYIWWEKLIHFSLECKVQRIVFVIVNWLLHYFCVVGSPKAALDVVKKEL